jgi:amino acid transporter
MASEGSRRNRPASDQLHPLVYTAVVGLVFWIVVSAWAFFDDGEGMELLLAVVSGFLFIAVAIPFALGLIWRKYQDADAARGERISLRDWASGEFDTWQGRRKAVDAAVEILLPFAAIAFGIMALGIVLHFTAATPVHL